MNIDVQETRYLLFLSEQKMVIKLVRPRLSEALALALKVRDLFRAQRPNGLEECLGILAEEDLLPMLRYLLFQGIVDNRSESRFSARHSRNIAKTIFSMVGILNVQEFADPCPMQDRVLLWRFMYHVFEKDAFKAIFALNNPKNFGEMGNRLVVTNYSDLAIQDLLRTHDWAFTNASEIMTGPYVVPSAA